MPHAQSQSEEPAVSVVVPFYGIDVSMLSKCVESLLDQDYPKDRVDIVIVDNNEIASLPGLMFEERCTIFHEPRPGSYAARNRGISESFGDIIAFTDSDCIPQRSWISAGVRALKESTRSVIVGGPIVFAFGNGLSKTACELLDSIVHHRQTEYIFAQRFAATANLFITRELVTTYGPFDARFLSGGDREFGQRLSAAGVRTVMAEDAVVVHPARARFFDLLQKNLRGTGGDKTFLDVSGKSSSWAIFGIQIKSYLHRQRLISVRAKPLGATPRQLFTVRALLILIYIARLLEGARLILGGRPQRV
jgi:GT2 family glycosyltransferase